MGEAEDQNEATKTSSEITFNNITILKEFTNIASLVRSEDFLETVPKAKLRRVKWVPMFDCLKQGIFNDMVRDLSSMWEFENMPEKLKILDKQKKRFSEINPDKKSWRPNHSDVKRQLRAFDVANLQKQKTLLKALAKEYEVRVSTLKKTIATKRCYVKSLQMDTQKYQNKNEEIFTKINEQIMNHKGLVDLIEPNKINIDDVNWS